MSLRRGRWARVGAGALALLALSIGGRVYAQSRPADEDEGGPVSVRASTRPGEVAGRSLYVVTVAQGDQSTEAASRVSAAVRRAMRTLPEAQWSRADQRISAYADEERAHLASAREKLARGRDAYLAVELERAVELLSSAVDDFDVASALVESSEEVSEALLYLGAAQVLTGDERGAQTTFLRLQLQMPERRPDPDAFNPDVVERYEAALPRDRRSVTGSLTVESTPPGAWVYVDYSGRGRTPASLDRLTAGTHLVRVAYPGYGPQIQTVEVRRGARATVNVELRAEREGRAIAEAVATLEAHRGDEAGGRAPLAALGRALGVDLVGVVRVARDAEGVALEVTFVDVASGQRVAAASERASLEQGLEQVAARLVLEEARVAQSAQVSARRGGDGRVAIIPTERDEPATSGGTITSKWWFWTAIGGAVVLGTIGILAATSGDEGPPQGQDPGGQLILEL